jgi:hypothetical protein
MLIGLLHNGYRAGAADFLSGNQACKERAGAMILSDVHLLE